MLWSLERSPGRLGKRILPSVDLCGRKEQFFRMSAERREWEERGGVAGQKSGNFSDKCG